MEVWVSQLSDEEIFREIGKIIQDFDLYQCDDCAVKLAPQQ